MLVKKFLPIVVIVILAVAVGYRFGKTGFKPALVVNKVPANQVDFSKFWSVWDKVSAEYVDKTALDPNKMMEGAIGGMVASIGDPYTLYLNTEQNKAEKDSLGGTFEGVGIQLGYKDKKLVVVSPLEGTPAKRAGVRAGDFIVKIKDTLKKIDKDTTDMTLPEAVGLIRGEKGTTVELTLVRDGVADPIVVVLGRDTISVRSVEVEMVGQIAWVKVARFGDRTQEEWNSAVASLHNVKGIVLDLRNNPGGYLEGSVYLTSEFLPKGKTVVIQQMGDGTRIDDKVTRDGKLLKTPMVVLVNEGSASAAEIMAGAIHDYKRAKIVGVKSFGKGSVQQPEDLPDGSGLHVTIAKWLTPSGIWIDKNGITPDVEVKVDPSKDILTPADDAQLQKAMQLL